MPTIHSENFFAKFEEQFRPFVAELGIPESVFSRQDIEIPTTKYAELLELIARKSNPYIGLDMGAQLTLQDMGVVGHAMAATRNVGEMLAVMAQYLYIFSHSNTVRLDVGGSNVACTYKVTILQPDLIRQDVECALAFITHAIRQASMQDFRPALVEFEHSRFSDVARHHELFGIEPRFGSNANRLHFPRKVLDYPVMTSDPSLLEALRFYLDDRIKTRSEEGDLLAKTNHLISASLSQRVPDQDWIASQLGMSSRTLQRKLADLDVVFSDLVGEIRKGIALDYIKHTDYNLTEIALMLGYGELSSFSRAFKRWTGTSPQGMRKGNRG